MYQLHPGPLRLGDADLRGVNLRYARCDGADLTGAKWSKSAPLPEGWKLCTGSDRLERPLRVR
jgi:hypothetical protein